MKANQKLLSVRDLHISSIDKTLVEDISFELLSGSSLGIVGESGSGKSLTLRAIAGILPNSLKQSGQIDLPLPGAPGSGMAMIFQEPATALNPTMRVGTFVARAWALHHPGKSKKESIDAAERLFEQVGISDAREKLKAWPHELSGGIRQRVMISAALATEPQVLLCDEPTTALDVRVQAQILQLINSLVKERNMAMIFVSHDLAVVSSVCEEIVVMKQGVFVERGKAASVLGNPSHPYTKALLDANLSRRLNSRNIVSDGRVNE